MAMLLLLRLLPPCSAAQRELTGGKRITATNCMSAKVMRFVLQLLEMPAMGPGGEVRAHSCRIADAVGFV